MSKSVDDAVCDYFSLLLNEPQTKCAVASSVTEGDYAQSKTLECTKLASREADERLSRQALEQLFARSPQESANKVEPQYSTATLASADTLTDISPAAGIASISHDSTFSHHTKIEPESELLADSAVISDSAQPQDLTPQTTEQLINEPLVSTQTLLEQLDEEFQVLFFKVAGLTLAVPLVSLGGIVSVDKITRLMGRPSWYMGVQQHREAQLNVVDTCAWVMPEKYDEQLSENVTYQYVVLLENSDWGLACESLVDTISIKKSDINWRSQAGKRPWLAGVVKERMCGILNVETLVQMLGSGLGCQDWVVKTA
ncbi:chemotaxis protein CheW [Shewanella sp. 125m-1]